MASSRPQKRATKAVAAPILLRVGRSLQFKTHGSFEISHRPLRIRRRLACNQTIGTRTKSAILARFLSLRYPQVVAQVTLDIPDELFAAFSTPGRELSRSVFEAVALEAYRERKLSTAQLRRLLGFETGYELDGFLKAHQVWPEYSLEDLKRDREAQRKLGL